MSSLTTGDLKLVKPATTDNISQTIDVDLPANFDKIDEAVSNKVVKVSGSRLVSETEIANFNDKYTRLEVDNKISSVYRYKGSVTTYANLPTVGQVVGDVYNVTDTGINYAWASTGWDDIGGVEALATLTNNGLLRKEDFAKLQGISANAKNVASSTTNGNIKIDNVETTVYNDTEVLTRLADIATQVNIQQAQVLINSEAEKQQQLTSNYMKRIEDYANIISMPNNASGNVDVNLGGMSLKNELLYNRDTWAEWTKSAGVIGDSIGIEWTANGSFQSIALSKVFKSNTKYGVLYSVINSNTNSVFYIAPTNLLLSNANLPQTIGNQKILLTTIANVTRDNFSITLGDLNTIGTKIKLSGLRVFELPTGSQIEADFTNLTADQLAVKYPYVKGDSTKNVCGSGKVVNKRKNLLKNYDKDVKISTLGTTDIPYKVKPNTNMHLKIYNLNLTTGNTIAIKSKDKNTTIYSLEPITGDRYFTFNTGLNDVIYLRFYLTTSIPITYNYAQLEEGTTAAPYEPYVSNTTYIQAKENNLIVENRSLPNLVKDEIYFNKVMVKWRRKQNVMPYTLQASDVIAINTSGVNVDRINIGKKIDMLSYNIVLPTNATILIPNYTFGSYVDDASKVGIVYDATITVYALIVAKGTYATLAQAQAALVGTKIQYQLATPIETDIDYLGEPKAYSNGSASFEPCLWGYTSTVSTVITDARYPIKAITKVVRLDVVKGKIVETDVTANATISTDLLSIDIANIDTTKSYFYECEIDSQYTTNSYKVLDIEVDNGIVTHDYLASVADWVLTNNEAKATMLVCNNAGGASKIIAPAMDGKMYIIRNTSGQTITVKTASSTGITIATAKTATVIFTGTDFIKIGEV